MIDLNAAQVMVDAAPDLGDMNWYSIHYYCRNCCHSEHAFFKRGVKKFPFLCGRCGCEVVP